jgi:hypothetical protein
LSRWSSSKVLPAVMAERWRGSTAAGHLRPREGTGRGVRAPGSKANKMRAWRRKKGERRGGVRGAEFSGELGQYSGERFPRRGSLPREAESSAGSARERRSLKQDGEAGSEPRWLERATPVSARGCGGGGGRACSAAAGERREKWERAQWRRARVRGVGERGGARGPLACHLATGRAASAAVGRGAWERRQACDGCG